MKLKQTGFIDDKHVKLVIVYLSHIQRISTITDLIQ